MTETAMDDTAPLPDEVAMAAKAEMEKAEKEPDKAEEADESDKASDENAEEAEEGDDKAADQEDEGDDKDADEDSGEDKEPDKDAEDKKPRRRSRRDRRLAQLEQENREIKARLDEILQREQPQEIKEPREEDFADYNDYLKARDDYSRAQGKREASQEVKQQQEQEAERKRAEDLARNQRTMVETGREKYPDFAAVALDPESFDPSQDVAMVILESEMAADVAYYLGSHPDEADRLEDMTPIQVAREIGRIEASLSAKPAPKPKTPSAPDPAKPIGPGKDAPRQSLENCSYEEYVRRRRKSGT